MHLFFVLWHYKRISLWKLQFKNCFRIDRFTVLGSQECLEFVCWIHWIVPFSGRTVLRVWMDLCDYWPLFRSQGRTLLRVWIDLCDYWPLSRSQGELCFVFGSICAIIDRCSVLRGELCFVFGSICAIIDRCFVLKENFASCLDRFVRLLDCCFVLKENFASCLDRFVWILTTIWFSGRTLLRGLHWILFDYCCQLLGSQGEHYFLVCIGFCLIIVDNYLVLRENITSWFALDFVWLLLTTTCLSGRTLLRGLQWILFDYYSQLFGSQGELLLLWA